MKIRIAIVDDSTFVRTALSRIFMEDPRFTLAGSSATAEELIGKLDEWKPDVISLDINLPGISGLDAIPLILNKRSDTKIVVLSTYSKKDADLTLEALNRGAIDFIDKNNLSLFDFGLLRSTLIEKFLAISHALPHAQEEPHKAGRKEAAGAEARAPAVKAGPPILLCAIGASTGGPPAIQEVLESLPPRFLFPVVVAQHMPAGFTKVFAERLDALFEFDVKEAEEGEVLQKGKVYILPATHNSALRRTEGKCVVEFVLPAEQTFYRPSVDTLFKSVAEAYGGQALAILLTGMGNDGARGLYAVKEKGGTTVAESDKSAVIYGMPRAAIEIGAAQMILTLKEIAGWLKAAVKPG